LLGCKVRGGGSEKEGCGWLLAQNLIIGRASQQEMMQRVNLLVSRSPKRC
jgi:hypothetical protein